jgi:DNA-binding MarR family transcriptional regulator
VNRLDDAEDRLWRNFQLMQVQLRSALARNLRTKSDLSYPDYGVLTALIAQPDSCMRVTELGSALGWSNSRVSHQVSRMAKRGLVEKKQLCEGDARGALVVITDQGRARFADATPAHIAAVRRLFLDCLTPESITVLTEVAERVLSRLGFDRSPVEQAR